MRRPQRGGGEAGGVKRVAVLPFENLGAPEDDYFADGIADAVRGKLTSLPGLEVIARGSSTPYKKTTKTPRRSPRSSKRAILLTATVRWQKGGGGNRVLVSPELVEVRASGAPALEWQQPFDAAITDVFQVQSDIATKVAQALGGALAAGEEKRLAEKPTQNLAAYDAFLKGEECGERPGSSRSGQPAQGARLLRAGRGAGSRIRAGVGENLVRQFAAVRQQHADARASGARPAGSGEGRRACTKPTGGIPGSRHLRTVGSRGPHTAPWSSTRRGCALRPATPPLSVERRLPSRGSGAGTLRWSTSGKRSASIPGPSAFCGVLAKRSSGYDVIPRRGMLSTVVSPWLPPTSF